MINLILAIPVLVILVCIAVMFVLFVASIIQIKRWHKGRLSDDSAFGRALCCERK